MPCTAGERGRGRRYRVEHRVGAEAVVLAHGWDVMPRRRLGAVAHRWPRPRPPAGG